MKTKRTRWWLKSAALLCATVFGLTAFGDYYEWTSTDKGYWEDDTSWTVNTADFTDYRAGNTGSEIAFKTPATADDTYGVVIYNNTYSFSADDAAYGLTKANAGMYVSTWWDNGAVTLNVASGTYGFSEVAVNEAGANNSGTTAALNLNGGSLSAGAVRVATGGTLTLNGGTLATTSVSGTGTLAIGANGGTFANGENATVSATLSGSGTLTKTGAGTLAFTGSYAAFTGKIAVAEGAGSVTVGDTTIAAGEEVQFGVYTWTGAGTAVEPEEEGGETTYTDTDLWSNINNWLVNNAVPATAPAVDSKVVIPAGDGTELTIRISGSSDCTGFLTINRDVKFVRPNSGTNGWGIRVSKVEGTGKLTLAGNNRGDPLVYDWLHIYTGQATDGEIIIDTDLQVEAYVQLEGTTPLRVNGAFSGGARFTCYSSDGQQGVHFHGDTSGFTGSYTGGTRASGSRDGTEFYGSALGSASGSWTFGGEFSKNAGYSPLNAGNGVTYEFGQLTTIFDGYNRLTFETYHKSSNSDYASNVTLKIGGRANSTSNVGGAINGTNNKIEKVGATSTLNLTLTETAGTVEAKEGTTVLMGTVAPAALNFTGTGATVKVASTVGTYETQTVVVTPAVEDNPETEEDESADAVTEEQQVMTAAFVPGIDSSLAGCQFATTTETIDNVEYTVYTLADVAKDSNDVAYKSVALAVAALAEAEDKTITLTASTTEAVALPLGYTLVMNGFTAGSVAGVVGVAVSYNEETQTYATFDNTSATWQGDASGANWADATNWSTGAIPDEGTVVKFTYNALVYISDHDDLAHKCASMDIANNVTVEFAPPEKNYTIYPRVAVYGDITGGKGTLKLWRSGIINLKGEGVSVYPAVQFENPGFYDGQTRDSWFQNGFTFRGDVTGTGVLVIYNACTFNNADINVPEGSVVDFRANPTLSHASEKLTGTGTVIVHATPANASRWKGALQNSENWQGVTEVQGAIDSIDAANFGGTGSTVRFNGVSGYLRASKNATTEVGKVKTIEIGANGLTLNNGFSSGTFGYIIAADITGSGPIHFGTRHNDASVGQYFLTGSLDGFTGAIDFGSLTSYRPAVIIKDPNTYAPAVNDYGQIIVAAERTVTVSGAWNAPGGFVVLGNVNVASTGSITSTNGLCGDGTVAYEAIPANTTTLTFSAGGTSSGTSREIPAWTGSVELPATVISQKTGIPLPGLSSDNGKLVIKGITRSTNANSIYLGTGVSCTMKGTVQLDGDLYVTDGNSNATYTWNKLTGSGAFFVTTAGGSASGITHAVTTLDNYTGTITAGGNVSLTIGTVAVDAVEVGVPVVKLAADSTLTTNPAAIALKVAGEASELTLVKADDGNLYVAVAAVTVEPEEGEPVTTQFATYEEAAAFADENSVTSFAVLAGDGAFNGWDYNSEAGTLTKNSAAIARVGTTNYATLSAAFAAAGEDDTVVLFGTSAEEVTLAADGAKLLVLADAAFTGTLKGNGTAQFDAEPTTITLTPGDWTGTFIANWDYADNSSALKIGKYGLDGSTLALTGLSHGYWRNADNSGQPNCQATIRLDGDVTIDNGFGNNTPFANGYVTYMKYLTGTGNFNLSFNTGYTYASYEIGTLKSDYTGTINANSKAALKIDAVEVTTNPAFGDKVVPMTIAEGALVVARIDANRPLVAKADGLYFDPVAQVGEAYYNTLAEAIAAANGATVALVKSTEEGVVVAADQTVVIKFGDYSTGDITAATDYVLNTSWDDATKTGTYTCTAVAGTEADDGSGNKFTVPATVATPAGKTLTDAATGTINYAQAYALGLWDGTAEGAVAEPTVSINIVDGKVQVAFAGGTVPEAYTVTAILQYKTALGTTSEWQNVEGDGATGALGATLVDQSEMGTNKFYRVIVTICDKAGDANVGNEGAEGTGA